MDKLKIANLFYSFRFFFLRMHPGYCQIAIFLIITYIFSTAFRACRNLERYIYQNCVCYIIGIYKLKTGYFKLQFKDL